MPWIHVRVHQFASGDISMRTYRRGRLQLGGLRGAVCSGQCRRGRRHELIELVQPALRQLASVRHPQGRKGWE